MNYIYILLFIITIIAIYYYFINTQIPINVPVIEKIDPYIEDLSQHNKLVLNQLDDYIKKQTIPNYSQESIPNGTLKFYDFHDSY